MSPSLGRNDREREPRWLDDDVIAAEDQLAGSAPNLVSLGFIKATLRRSAWFWCIAAVAGLLVGSGLYLRSAHTHQASTTLLLTVGPEPQPGTAILGDQAIAQSHAVAGLALHKLGLRESVDSFLRSYTVTVLTDRILQITATAPSSDRALRTASELATEFLTFRADQVKAEQRLEFAALNQQIAQGKQRVASITHQINQVSAQPRSPSKLAELSALQGQADRASTDLAALEQAASANMAATQITTASMTGASKVLDPASLVPPHSRTKRILLYIGGGFLIGLILAMSIVVVRALLSERLRRRDDVALALGAPVTSVPAVRTSRGLPGWGGRASGYQLQRIVEHLRGAVPAGPRGTVTLAVVPVGQPQVAAMAVVALAKSYAQDGASVVVADLSAGARAAALLGAKSPGVHAVSADGAQLVAVLPDPAEFAPIGPFNPAPRRARSASARELAAACRSADLLLTLIPLDPSVGAEHLGTWAADAVVMVTAGQSSWTKIHAVGEMIRLAGTRLAFAVLVGADKTDESLGVTSARPVQHQSDSLWPVAADIERSLTGGPGGAAPEDNTVPAVQSDPREHADHGLRRGE